MASPPVPDRAALHAHCEDCVALCCAAFAFTRSADFPEDKSAGTPCHHLDQDHSCTIHDRLEARGYRGCIAFDCFGAGQRVTRSFGDDAARTSPRDAALVHDVFTVVRQLHEMLWHLAEATRRAYEGTTVDAAHDLSEGLSALTRREPHHLARLDVESLRDEVRAVLVDTSRQVRAAYRATDRKAGGLGGSGADLAGRDLRRLDLVGEDLRGACLIGSDLRGSDLTAVDLLGADLRGARLDGADLADALFVTQGQLQSAHGNDATALPPDVRRPLTWSGRSAHRERQPEVVEGRGHRRVWGGPHA
ncbi:pentapeptide repeat-containing protein [Rhodococcus sp. HNM0569]|uniref:pentapeptide repeat-containing protein n=1 Tax=Rhodococcus sp. HNM0569 TaxID=2716340 RepID=UPI00146E383E|nr:pentapeptide repeat-containing protein [Rhodococcus sp. HNM0569]NLU82813.1 pentapeptide repeat-containing protein [Rhodococcus sp. HNM0569]